MTRDTMHSFGSLDTGHRDEQADGEVAAILAGLPADHLARRAFARGRSTADITVHLRDRRDLAYRLMNVSWDYHQRTRRKHSRNEPRPYV